MVFSMEEDEPGGYTQIYQHIEKLQSIGQRHSVILIRMEHQRGRFDVGGIFQRGLPPHVLRIAVWFTCQFLPYKGIADIGDIHADPVGNGTLGGGGPEAIGMPDDPVGHEPAVAAARHTQPTAVDLRIFCQHCVSEIHQISIIRFAVMSADISKGVIPPVAALGIAEENEIPFSCPDLHFVEKTAP